MSKSNFEKYLKERYYTQIDWYNRNAIYYKNLYTTFQWIVIVLSTAIPVLILIIPCEYKMYTTTIGILLAIFSTGMKTFKFQENWINYRTIAESLKKEICFFNADIYDYYLSSDKESVFIERVENLISRENTIWFVTHINRKES